MPAKLTDLPVELIQQIHLLAHNPFLPQSSLLLYYALHNPSPTYTARYFLSLYADFRAKDVLVRALRHPVCGVEEARALRDIWDGRRGAGPWRGGDRTVTLPRLECPELPRRLFRSPTPPTPPIPPLLPFLYANYTQSPPSPNSHKGYPLCRAVLQRNYELVRFLLRKGADPGLKNFMAVEIAVEMRDLRMVKLLVEREANEGEGEPTSDLPDNSPRTAKRVKLSDRIVVGTRMVEVAMKKGATDIVNYLVYDKSVMPPLQSIMDMSKTDNSKSKPKPKSHTRHKPSRAGHTASTQAVGTGGKKRRRNTGF
ncbi:hypothetical protein IAT38_007146 [Cryptococcus sp. DSM 104549]